MDVNEGGTHSELHAASLLIPYRHTPYQRWEQGPQTATGGPPFLHQVSLNPLHNLTPQPDDILGWIVSSGILPLSIRSPTNVDNVNQRIRMPKVVQELISQPSPFMSTRHKTRDVEELNGHGSFAIIARAIVRFALV